MKPKHTPGPWFLDNQWEKLTIKNIREMPMKNGTIEEIVLDISQGFIPNSANVLLIAAAPEMFAALELLINAISECPEYQDAMKSFGFDIEVVDAIKESKSILKKARGEK